MTRSNILTGIWGFLKKPFVSLAFRVTISGVLLFYLFRLSAFEKIAEAFSQVELTFLLGFFVLYGISLSFQVLRWKYLLAAWKVEEKYGTLFRWVTTGLFLNNFLPGSLGGDAYRLLAGTRRTGRANVVAATIFYERILGYGSLVTMGLVTLIIRADFSGDWLFWLILGGVFLGLVGIALISYVPSLRRLVNRFIEKIQLLQKINLKDWLSSFRFKVSRPNMLAGILIVSFLIQILDTLGFWLIANALQISVRLSDLFLFVPLLYLVILLPISVNGIGIRETVFVMFSARWGISSANAVAFSLTVFALNLAGSLIGGPLYWVDRENLRANENHMKDQDGSIKDDLV